MAKKGYCVPVDARDGHTHGGTGWYSIAVAALLASPSMYVVAEYLQQIVPTSIAVGDLSRTLGRRPMIDSKGGACVVVVTMEMLAHVHVLVNVQFRSTAVIA